MFNVKRGSFQVLKEARNHKAFESAPLQRPDNSFLKFNADMSILNEQKSVKHLKRENQTVDSKQVLGSKFGGYAYSEQMILRFVISKPTQVSKDSSGDLGFNFSLERLQKQRYFWQKKERNTRKLLRTSHLHNTHLTAHLTPGHLHTLDLYISHLQIPHLRSARRDMKADNWRQACQKAGAESSSQD